MREHVLHFDWETEFPRLTHSKGVYLYDADGKEYLDGSSGSISNSLRYAREDMAEAIYEQYKKIAHSLRYVSITTVQEEACDALAKKTDMDRVFMVSGGTEATEIAVKIARVYWHWQGKSSKYKIIGRWMGYHGYSMESLSWGGNIARRYDYTPYLREDGHIPPPYCYRCWYGKDCEHCNLECAQALETEILCQGPDSVAAFISEPVGGTTLAAVTPPKGYYKKIREICDKYDVLLIADEVMCGSGRTGKMRAMDHFDVKPDILVLAKALGGGYFPVGAVCITENVVEPIKAKKHFTPGFTWAGNPVASRVVLKTLEIMEKENLFENVTKMGDYMKGELIKMADRHPTMGNVRGKGLMIGVEFVKDKKTKEYFDPTLNFTKAMNQNAQKLGLMINPSSKFDKGQGGDGTLMGPCFEVKKEEIDLLLERFEEALSITEREFLK